MRIAMISEHASPLAPIGGIDAGGQNVHVAELGAALVRRGHAVTVYTRRDDPHLPRRVATATGVEVVHVDAGPAARVSKDELLPYMSQMARAIAQDWALCAPDVVHAHFWMSGLAALAAAKQSLPAPPVLETFHALGSVKRRHQGGADTSPPQRRWLEPEVAVRVDRILATCPDEVGELIALGADPAHISVAPCGVDLALFTPHGTVEQTDGTTRIAVVGRLVPRKGIDVVIRALARLTGQGRAGVVLHVVGGSAGEYALDHDPEALRLRALAGELGVSDRVVFRGQLARDEMPAFLRSCAAVVCTPWYEPFGIVPLEAMACAVPVVVSAVGGLQDSVVDGVTGLHVPPRDDTALAAALTRLLADPAMGRRMGAAGRRRVERGYSWDRVAALSEDAYSAALTTRLTAPVEVLP